MDPYKYKRVDGKVIDIPLSAFWKGALDVGAIKISEHNGSEHIEVTQQENPEWDNGWRGTEHIQRAGGTLNVAHKYLPLKMYKYSDGQKRQYAIDKTFQEMEDSIDHKG